MYIFLATSFSSKVLPDGSVEPEYRTQLEAIIAALESRGHIVLCGLREDGWRLNDQSPLAAFTYDVHSVEKADLLLVLIRNKPVSAGTQFELGYAQALDKEILIFSQANDKPVPYINLGLIQQDNVRTQEYGSLTEVPALLEKLV